MRARKKAYGGKYVSTAGIIPRFGVYIPGQVGKGEFCYYEKVLSRKKGLDFGDEPTRHG